VSNLALSHVSKWFSANKLFPSLHKTNIIKSLMNNLPQCALGIGCKEKCIEERVNGTFFRLQIDNHFNWKNHIDQMISKLSGAF
jgi:hypothetical protein